MTHDELLDKIYWHWRYVQGNDGLQAMTDYRRALLAVVELHRPIFRGCDEPSCCGDEDVCRCSDEYPCDTIKAIEKELA
jgi:hypothetical protein